MRTYEKTHAWITFKCDLNGADPHLWMALGEAASKCEHIARVPLRPAVARELHKLYLSKGIAGTTAIEGNTLSEEQVRAAIDGTLSVPPSKEYQKQEVENILGATRQIFKQLADGLLPALTPRLLCEYNAHVLRALPLEEGVEAGKIRQYSVTVGNVYRGAPADDCEYLVERLCACLNEPEFHPPDQRDPALPIVYGILRAIFAHLYLAWIHPFGDGNGRTARLVEFHILLAAGVPSPAASLLSNHYNQTRSEYYRQLDRASKSGGKIVPFINYATRGFVDGLREQLEAIWDQQWDITWRNYVYERFGTEKSAVNRRRCQLALELGETRHAVRIAELPDLSPRLARDYVGKTSKTIQRDVEALVQLGLASKKGGEVRARREVILGFLPLRGDSAGSQT